MSEIRSGFVTALYLFDVAARIDLARVQAQLGDRAVAARLDDKSAGPARIRYVQAPLIVGGDALDIAAVDGFRVRVKFYDYGVVSLMLSRPFSGSWADLVALAQTHIENEPLDDIATRACHRIVEMLAPAFTERRTVFLDEEYLVFAVTGLSEPTDADTLVEHHGEEIAQMLRGERAPLSRQEREALLQNRFSYFHDDLVVPAWNAAFILDSETGALASLEILELANSQLLEFRYYDELLENELTHVYATLQQPHWTDRLAGRRHRRAALHLHALFIDINELTDRLENTVKFVGDIYAARLFGNVAARLGLDRWKRNVEEKLETLDDIYRFAVEQTGMSQANLLELVIVAILVIELGFFFAGIMR